MIYPGIASLSPGIANNFPCARDMIAFLWKLLSLLHMSWKQIRSRITSLFLRIVCWVHDWQTIPVYNNDLKPEQGKDTDLIHSGRGDSETQVEPIRPSKLITSRK